MIAIINTYNKKSQFFIATYSIKDPCRSYNYIDKNCELLLQKNNRKSDQHILLLLDDRNLAVEYARKRALTVIANTKIIKNNITISYSMERYVQIIKDSHLYFNNSTHIFIHRIWEVIKVGSEFDLSNNEYKFLSDKPLPLEDIKDYSKFKKANYLL